MAYVHVSKSKQENINYKLVDTLLLTKIDFQNN